VATRLTKSDEAYAEGSIRGWDNGVKAERVRILKILDEIQQKHDIGPAMAEAVARIYSER
jgi:hypothetical protein